MRVVEIILTVLAGMAITLLMAAGLVLYFLISTT